ncbi:8000_t:CDS:2, partial [Funneliformis geosporum]
PEVIFGKGYTFASDIYSIGMLMWEISSGQPPFAGFEHNYDLVMKIMNGLRPKIVSETPLEYANLMVQCWNAHPFKRPKINILDNKIKQMRKFSITPVISLDEEQSHATLKVKLRENLSTNLTRNNPGT